MPIKFRCEHCRQLLGISQTKAGEMVDCPTCGRAVRVPSLDGKSDPISIPKWDSQDQSLVNALNALASFTEKPVRPTETVDPAGTDEPCTSSTKEAGLDQPDKPVTAPLVTVIPEPIEMPPLDTPVVLPEPTNPPSPPVPSAVALSENTEEPWSKLATLSDAASSSTASRDSRPNNGSIPPSHPGKGVTLPIALLLVAMAFGLGYFVGNARNASAPFPSPEITQWNDTDEQETTTNETALSVPSARRRAVEGRITYVSAAGSSQSDTGAIVILLPAYRKSSVRLSIVGFRPADSSEDREIAKASLTVLGGDLAVVDDQGLFACDLPQAGEYHMIILSRHLERAETESLEAPIRTLLGEYFDRPQQLVGQLKFHVSELTYRGEDTEIRDHTFGRES